MDKGNRRTISKRNGETNVFPKRAISILELQDEDTEDLPDKEFSKKKKSCYNSAETVKNKGKSLMNISQKRPAVNRIKLQYLKLRIQYSKLK